MVDLASAASRFAATENVAIVDFDFQPSSLTVNVGDTVVWTNRGFTAHTTTSDTGMWASPFLGTGGSFSFTFNSPGTFTYYCVPHPFMRGTIIVTGAAAPTTTATSIPAVATPTSTATSTAPQPTGTAGGLIGGRGFALRSGSGNTTQLTWVGGTRGTGYALLRLSGGAVTAVPLPGSGTTTYLDSAPPADPLVCYILVALDGATPLGNSDLLCAFRNARSGAGPSDFSIRLDQSTTATLSWGVAAGANAYQLFPLGGVPISLPANATTATHQTAGAATCYVMFALSGATAIGNSDLLCGLPGAATLASNLVFAMSRDAHLWTMTAMTEDTTVRADDYTFEPAYLTVPVGATVVWANTDPEAHTVTSDFGVFDGEIGPGESFRYTFLQPGVYFYYCRPHDWMIGEITVVVESEPGPPGSPPDSARPATPPADSTPTGTPTTTAPAAAPGTSTPTMRTTVSAAATPTRTPTATSTATATATPTATLTPTLTPVTALRSGGSGAIVQIRDFAFQPASVTISVGQSVRWTNRDQVAHTATGPGFDVVLPPGRTGTATFTTAGRFAYICTPHSFMTGEVVVTGP